MARVEELSERQSGMLARRQLNAGGWDADRVAAQVAARRWVVRTPRVISTTTGELTWEQRCWLAVLHAGPRSLLGGLSAAEALGLTHWHRDVITVLVDDELAFEPVEGVRFFRSRRPFELLRVTETRRPPRSARAGDPPVGRLRRTHQGSTRRPRCLRPATTHHA